MLWFFLGFLLYGLALFAEQAVVGVSPHDLERLRATEGSAAQRAYKLGNQAREALAALLLARVLLLVMLAISGTAWALRSEWLNSAIYQMATNNGLPLLLLWGLVLLLLSASFALMAWLIQKIKFKAERAPFWLKTLGPFVAFWCTTLGFLIKNEKTTESLTPALASADPHDFTSSAAENNLQNGGEKRDIELLKSIVKFGDVTVKQVMQPRSKVVAVDFRTDFEHLLAIVREAGFSRLPVYDQDLDNLTGILYVKDLVQHLDKGPDFEWQSLIRTNVLLVPESKRVSELLQEFKARKRHMAIVVDEYGGSSGIVTMEDVLEEVTGEIQDEFDDEESAIRYRKLDEYNYIFEGQILLNDVYRLTGLDPDAFEEVRGDADTLAGLALELRGDIPKTGTEIPWNGYLLTVLVANSRRIEQLKLTLPK